MLVLRSNNKEILEIQVCWILMFMCSCGALLEPRSLEGFKVEGSCISNVWRGLDHGFWEVGIRKAVAWSCQFNDCSRFRTGLLREIRVWTSAKMRITCAHPAGAAFHEWRVRDPPRPLPASRQSSKALACSRQEGDKQASRTKQG